MYDDLRACRDLDSQAHFTPPHLPFRPELLTDVSAMRAELEQYLLNATSGFFGGVDEAKDDLNVYKALFLDNLNSTQLTVLYLGVAFRFDITIEYLVYLGLLSDANEMQDTHTAPATYWKVPGTDGTIKLVRDATRRDDVRSWSDSAIHRPNYTAEVEPYLSALFADSPPFQPYSMDAQPFQIGRKGWRLSARKQLEALVLQDPRNPAPYRSRWLACAGHAEAPTRYFEVFEHSWRDDTIERLREQVSALLDPKLQS